LAPTASEIILPADGAVVLVGGTDNPIDPQTPLVIVWTAAEDPESQPIQYWWQVSSNAAFDDTLATVSAGTVNQLPTTLGYLGGLMRASGVEFDATVTWYHRIIAFDGADYVTGPAIAVTLTLGAFVSNETDLPVRAQLFGNYPNPFSGSTSIGYQTDEAGEVRLAVYDVRGAIVQSAAAWFSAPGTHTFHVRGDGLAAGVYLYTIRGGGLMGTGRLVRVER
jgi:hypothetical protein